MTDNEIIKALRECTNNGYNSEDGTCRRCPLQDFSPAPEECMTELLRNALNLINRQQAEIERSKTECGLAKFDKYKAEFEEFRAEIKAEAIKEFEDKIKDEFDKHGVDYTAYVIVDDVAREVAGDN